MSRRMLPALIAGAAAAMLGGCRGAVEDPPPVVEKVDLDRYLGTWHEIAHLPFWAQKNCHAATATYVKRPDGRIGVVNACRKGSPDGKEKKATAVAWVADGSAGGKLKVRFFWPFTGDYWILALGSDYEYALVGTPDRKYLWILSRSPTMPDGLYSSLVGKGRALGYDVDRLVRS